MATLVAVQLLAGECFDAIAAAHDITFGDYLVLGAIRRSDPKLVGPGHVASVLHRTSGGMTLTLDRLERSGYLERTSDSIDRRRVLLTLTDAGRTLATSVNRALHAWEDDLLARHPDLEHVRGSLGDLAAALEGLT